MNRRQTDLTAPYQTIDNTSRLTGLSRDYIRRRVKEGRIPFIRGGSGNSAYMICVPRFMQQLDAEAAANTKGGGNTMMSSGKPATSAATLGRAEAEQAAGRTSYPCGHYTTFSSGRQPGFIEGLLPRGENNAIPTAQLVALTGYRSARELQRQIEAERQRGALILSRSGNGGGYFLPSEGEKGKREIALYVQTLRARAVNTLRTIRSAKAALREVDGQQHLEVWRIDGAEAQADG